MILKDKYTKYFLLLLSGLFILRMILLGQFNLVPQEAYYWLYIQKPALSYFDHPPVCSYTIGIFTYLFGNTEFGVRFGMLLYSLGTSIFVFLLGKNISGSTRFAFLSVVFLNLTVFFNLHSVVATPDAPLLFFWSASMYFYFKAINEGNKSRDWLLAGVFAGIALASKYTAFFLFFSLFLYLILTKNWKEFLSWKLWLSVVVAFLVFSPVIIWNFQNGWASFLFQTSHRAKGVRSFGFNYFFQLIASQIFELTPLFFVLLWIILWRIIKRFTALSKEKLFFACFAFPVVLFFFHYSELFFN
jgi:4-amino-4-deoxy-L-arabinose transferase-like glycosyltransferase